MNLLLIDDHPLFGVGLAHALTRARPGILVRTALTLDEGLAIAAGWDALDAVLIDHRLGAEDGTAGLRRVAALRPLVARVLISGDEQPRLALAARAAGAVGFLGKSAPVDAVLAALDAILEGGEHFPAPMPRAPVPGVTARQLEVLELVAQGRQNKTIADRLGIAERTVKLHVTALFAVTSARNRTHLLVRAREMGLL